MAELEFKVGFHEYILHHEAIAKILEQDFLSAIERVERGFSLCFSPAGRLYPGVICTGDECSIEIKPECLKPAYWAVVGGFHTHPIGIAHPSISDVLSAEYKTNKFFRPDTRFYVEGESYLSLISGWEPELREERSLIGFAWQVRPNVGTLRKLLKEDLLLVEELVGCNFITITSLGFLSGVAKWYIDEARREARVRDVEWAERWLEDYERRILRAPR